MIQNTSLSFTVIGKVQLITTATELGCWDVKKMVYIMIQCCPVYTMQQLDCPLQKPVFVCVKRCAITTTVKMAIDLL